MASSSSATGTQIRAARHKAGLTQAALAQLIGTRERNIIRWENGQHEPRWEHVVAIADATRQPMEFFRSGLRRDGGTRGVDGDGAAADCEGVRRDAA